MQSAHTNRRQGLELLPTALFCSLPLSFYAPSSPHGGGTGADRGVLGCGSGASAAHHLFRPGILSRLAARRPVRFRYYVQYMRKIPSVSIRSLGEPPSQLTATLVVVRFLTCQLPQHKLHLGTEGNWKSQWSCQATSIFKPRQRLPRGRVACAFKSEPQSFDAQSFPSSSPSSHRFHLRVGSAGSWRSSQSQGPSLTIIPRFEYAGPS